MTILIHSAAGGIGSTAIQLAKVFGASKIIGTVSSEEKVQVAKTFGADHVINYGNGDFAEEVNRLTNGKGADVILDTIAGETFEKSINCLATFGSNYSYFLALFLSTSCGSSCTYRKADKALVRFC